MRDRSDPHERRFAALFDAFALAGVTAEHTLYNIGSPGEGENTLANRPRLVGWG